MLTGNCLALPFWMLRNEDVIEHIIKKSLIKLDIQSRVDSMTLEYKDLLVRPMIYRYMDRLDVTISLTLTSRVGALSPLTELKSFILDYQKKLLEWFKRFYCEADVQVDLYYEATSYASLAWSTKSTHRTNDYVYKKEITSK